MIRIVDDAIHAETRTLSAVFRRGWLVSLKSRADGAELLPAASAEGSALQLVYPHVAPVDVVGNLAATITVHRLSDHAAEFRFHGWDADGVLTIREDQATGELLVEPSAYSSRPGVMACRWRVAGCDPALDVVAPFFQGVRLRPDDPLLQRRWFWPQFWEAALILWQGPAGGFWIHCQDDRYRYKALTIDAQGYGFETDAYGPVDTSLGAGGLEWRINVHQGDWTQPAGQYRDWLWKAYRLGEQEALRKPWLADLRFAVSWFNGDPEILDALAETLDPRTVLLHFSQWRTDAYDENYPTYEASPAARQVIAKATAMGFHIMPHCNAVDMDPTNPVYSLIRDFQYRDVQTRRLHGWGYDREAGGVLGVPNSYGALDGNRRRKVMIKVHPGLAMWRSILAERIAGAVADVGTDTVFIDVTLCSHNLHNCLVESTTPSEGMNRLIRQIAALGEGLAVGGEGLNEITAQGLSTAQAHLFCSWHLNADGLERTGGLPFGEFLFGKLCRTFGYSNLSGADEVSALRMRIHAEHGALPTVTVGSADQIRRPNAAVAAELERARS